VAHPEDAVIYETHVRDFSIDANSGMKNRGKFLAFTETGTTGPGGVKTGVDSLKELGITHVEILPAFGCASLDEVAGGSTAVVIYASDVPASNIHGAWSLVADSSAAAGAKLSNPDAGAATVNAPAASPTDYFDASFKAGGGTR